MSSALVTYGATLVEAKVVESPYLGKIWGLIFDNNNYVGVHERFVRKHPGFAAKFNSGNLQLPGVPPSAAHVLMHFLYTGTYQVIQLAGQHGVDKTIYEFKTGVHIYGLSKEYGILMLEELASCELEGLGQMLNFGTIADIIDGREFLNTNMRGWLYDYLIYHANDAAEHISEEAAKGIRAQMGGNRVLSSFLCETAAKMGLECQRLRRAGGHPGVDRLMS